MTGGSPSLVIVLCHAFFSKRLMSRIFGSLLTETSYFGHRHNEPTEVKGTYMVDFPRLTKFESVYEFILECMWSLKPR